MNKRIFQKLLIASILIFIISGCYPTYPKSAFKESIVKLCKREYHLDVKVETVGKTIAIYVPLPNLIDFTFSISKEASEKINDVILSVSRVALSTDAEFDFYCIIAHDVRLPEIQIVIIKSVDDVKRFLLNDISRGEYSKRMLIDLRLNPQSQKERAVKAVFEKMALEQKWQDQVMNDFFRSEPAALGDIGYWSDRFYIKDITLPEFLAEQIASRIRMAFREDKALAEKFSLKLSKCVFVAKPGQSFFKAEVLAEPKELDAGETPLSRGEMVLNESAKIASEVLNGYKFFDFNYFEVQDQTNGMSLSVSRADLDAFRKKKLKIGDLLRNQQ